MKRNKIFKIVSFLFLATMAQGFMSCEETDSDLVAFVEDNNLNTPNDTVYSLMGIIGKMQVVADRTVLLGELRGELTTLTENASLDLQSIANFDVDTENPYNNARDFYGIIQNCNYFISKADSLLMKRGRRVFEKELAVVRTFRAWTYLQLAMNYGSVPFFTEPILFEKDADPQKYPFYNVEQLADYFVKDLAPCVDMDYPDYGAINGTNSRRFYYPVRVLMGDYCLWAGRYKEAAKYYHDYLTKQTDVHPTNIARAKWINYEFASISDTYASQFSNASEVLTIIPMEEDEYNGIISRLPDVFNSTEENNYYYQATHSKAYDELSQAQQYALVYSDPVTLLPDTVYATDTIHYENLLQKGDLRLNSIYTLRNQASASTAYSNIRQTCLKYSGTNVTLLRLHYVYLRFAEALNRAGYPQSAFAVLKYGLWRDNIEKYISAEEREAAGDLLSFSQYTFLLENTQGIHSRGSGDANANDLYVIPELPTKNDTINFVEERICDEMALETAAEGQRFYDLIRLSMHRNDPTFLARKVAGRNGAENFDSNLFNHLSDTKNWYLPLE